METSFIMALASKMTHFTFNSVHYSERAAAGELSPSLNATLTMKFEKLQGQASAVDKRAMCLCVSVSEIEKYMPLQHCDDCISN